MKYTKIYKDIGMPLDTKRRRAFNEFNEMVYNGDIKLDKITKCFCGEDDFQLLSRFDRFGLPFGTKICKACGLITQTIRINQESMASFYEKIYWPLVAGQGEYLTAPKDDETSPYILNHVPENWSEVRVFEVGCGSGTRISMLTNALRNQGRLVTAVGCDYSSEALKLTAQKEVETVFGGMEELTKKGKADILILSHVFEHFPDLSNAIRQITNLIHDESLVYVEVPGVVDLENKKEYLYSYQDYCVLAHTFNFSLMTLSAVMAPYNLKLIQGDEYVRAIFKKGEILRPIESSYGEILCALERAYKKHLLLESRRNHPVIKYLRNIAKVIIGREI